MLSLWETLTGYVGNGHDWFDRYRVSVQGDDWNHGAELLTQSPSKKGAQHLNLFFLSVHSKQHNNKYKCHVEDG